MTIGDYINARLKQWKVEVSEDIVKIAFVVAKVQPTDDFTSTSENAAFQVLYKLIPDIIISIPKSISEGGYSITYDKDAMIAFYTMIADKLNLPDEISGKASVKDITRRW